MGITGSTGRADYACGEGTGGKLKGRAPGRLRNPGMASLGRWARIVNYRRGGSRRGVGPRARATSPLEPLA
jgi:hypothetical protein